VTKIKAKKKQLIGRFLSFLKAAQIWSTHPMRYSPVQADQKKPNWAATRPIWQHCLLVQSSHGQNDWKFVGLIFPFQI